jgi:hypothetical protein
VIWQESGQEFDSPCKLVRIHLGFDPTGWLPARIVDFS